MHAVRYKLKLKTPHICLLSAPVKGRSFNTMLHCIVISKGTQQHGTFATQVKCYTGIEAMQWSFYYIWKTNNKLCKILQRFNTSTFIGNIGSLCNIVFPMLNLMCIITSKVFVNQHDIELCLLLELKEETFMRVLQL